MTIDPAFSSAPSPHGADVAAATTSGRKSAGAAPQVPALAFTSPTTSPLGAHTRGRDVGETAGSDTPAGHAREARDPLVTDSPRVSLAIAFSSAHGSR